MAEPQVQDAKIYVMSRENYDSTIIESNSIYFVREASSDTTKLLSLYLGDSRQTDILDISENVTYDDVTQNFDIPSEYQIENKLFFARYPLNTTVPDFYRVFIWNKSSNKFVDCFGNRNNVTVVISLPSTSQAIQNQVYISTGSDKGVYVFDGNDFNNVVDFSNYVTESQVQSMLPKPDNITIKQRNDKTIYAVGADLSGRDVVYTDVNGNQITRTAGTGATIYNNYQINPQCINVATGNYSNAFGNNVQSLNDYAFSAGIGIINNLERGTIFGSYNNKGSSSSDNGYLFVIGNGSEESETITRSDALTLDEDGNIVLYGDRTSSTGNIQASTGVTLSTIREQPSGTIQSEYVEDYLPENGHEILLSNSSNSYTEIESIQINDISHVINSTTLRTDDYSCIYIFNKDSSVIDITSLMPNFTSTNTSDIIVDTAPPKIYLLNPDLDISSFSTIHIMIFFDGLKMCAIVAGYES